MALVHYVTEQVLNGEVSANAVTNLEAFDRIGDTNDLAGTVGARYNALIRSKEVFTFGNEKVAILYIRKHRAGSRRNRYAPGERPHES